jgi:hypothetical protein
LRYPNIQRRFAVFVFLTSLVFVGAVGCSDSGSASAPAFYKVTYSVVIIGTTSEITSVTYTSESGDSTVLAPADGWSVTVQLPAGGSAGATSDAVVIDGGVQLEMTAEAGNASSIICDNIPSGICRWIRSETCENSGAMPDSCTMVINPVPLP